MNLYGRIENRADRCIVIQGIYDKRKEFAHIGGYKVRLLFRILRHVGLIGRDNFVDIPRFVKFI